MRRAVTALLMLLTGLAATTAASVGIAHACSCAGPSSARDQAARADIAFVGAATAVRRNGENSRLYTVEVEFVVKGDVSSVVEIEAGVFDGSCGVVVPLDQSIGFAPYRRAQQGDGVDGWSVDLCGGMVPASEMSAVADQRLPEPTGTGPVAAFVVARAGPADAVAVDAVARPLGYVVVDRSEGEYADIIGVAACPGGALATMVVLRSGADGVPTAMTLELLDLRTLDFVATVAETSLLLNLGWWAVSDMSCISDDGGSVMIVDGSLVGLGTDEQWSTTLETHGAALSGSELFTIDGRGVVRRPVADTADRAGDGEVVVATSTSEGEIGALAIGAERLFVARRGSGGKVDRVDSYSLDGTPDSTWSVEAIDLGRFEVGAGGAVLWDRNDGSQRWLQPDGSMIGLPSGGGAPLGEGVLSWSYEGVPVFEISGSSDEQPMSFIDAVQMRFVQSVNATVTVDPTSEGAQPLPIVATPGRLIDVVTTTTTSAATAEAPDSTLVSAPAVVDDTDDWPTPAVVTLAVAIAVFVVVALLWLRHTFARGPGIGDSAPHQ